MSARFDSSSSRMTPSVGRLIGANAIVLLLLQTVFINPRIVDALAFDPARGLSAPWTFVTYLFVHGGLLHLATNMLMLWVFGVPVEQRLGSRAFLLYYLYCGVGAAIFSLGLSAVIPVAPFIGASGAVLGVALAFARFWPDAEMLVFPLPIPIRAKTLVTLIVAIDMLSAFWFRDGIAHLAHVGGVIFGYLYFRLETYAHRPPASRPRRVERPVMVPTLPRETEHRPTAPTATASEDAGRAASSIAEEMDRVLDKISAHGMASLTTEERRFLDEMSRRKRENLH